MNRDLAWRSPITIVLVIASLVFLLLGPRTFLRPSAAAAFYGAATDLPDALVFVRAYGARNIAISLSALAFLWSDQRKALGVLLTGAALVAALDAGIMWEHSGPGGAAKHLAYVVGLSALAFATFRAGAARRTGT